MKHTADFIQADFIQTHCWLETRLFFLVESPYNNWVSFIVLTEPLDIQAPLDTFKCLPFISVMTLEVVKVVWAASHVFSCHMFGFILQFYVATMQC